jgi:two-component sensor histidine kinase
MVDVPAVADSLVLAMVASSDAPLLLLDGDLDVIAISNSFGRTFHIQTAAASGRPVFELGSGEWNLPKLQSLLSATAAGHAAIDAYEMDLRRGDETRRVVIKAQKLAYDEPHTARLLMTVCDVTDARMAERLKDDLLRERAILLEEVQHRVANSLQIIASVLLQSARNVQSEETRSHLQDAHNRVMSIATVQKQLALSSGQMEVELRPYFTQLCQSLGASMIRDHQKQSIEVAADSSSVKADVSVSLGLIVTELVINALKHAFPEGRPGKIQVDYHSHGPNWALGVKDNGIGMQQGAASTSPGLGTSIVEALARQLHARVHVNDAKPGTDVKVVHNHIAVVGSEEAEPEGRAV